MYLPGGSTRAVQRDTPSEAEALAGVRWGVASAVASSMWVSEAVHDEHGGAWRGAEGSSVVPAV